MQVLLTLALLGVKTRLFCLLQNVFTWSASPLRVHVGSEGVNLRWILAFWYTEEIDFLKDRTSTSHVLLRDRVGQVSSLGKKVFFGVPCNGEPKQWRRSPARSDVVPWLPRMIGLHRLRV